MPISTSKIKHIIYYMLENRSFDNVLGWLYDDTQKEKICLISNPSQQDVAFYGLEEHKYFNCFPDEDKKHFVQKGVGRDNVPLPDPHEEFEHVNVQLFYPEWRQAWLASPPSDKVATMKGFLADYSTAKKHVRFGGTISQDDAKQILMTYDRGELNILNTLAENFAVSDYWFSPVPTQTNSNRAFSVTGSSDGLVDNKGFLFAIVPDKFKGCTIWQELCCHGHSDPADWMIFYQDLLPYKNKKSGKIELKGFSYTRDAFDVPDPKKHVVHIDQLFETLQSKSSKRLPAFSYLEPLWVGLFEISGIGVCTSLPTTPHLVVGRSACRVGVGPSLNRSWAQRSRPVVQAGRRAFPGDESVVD